MSQAPKILIIGPGRHGKDTAAEIICGLTGWSFKSSSMFAAEKAVYPTMQRQEGYTSVMECFNDRHNHRVQWRDLIREYNSPDKSTLAKELLASGCNVYVGMRCHEEYAACVRDKVFDKVMWVEASERITLKDPSLTIEYDPRTMIRVGNNGSLVELEHKCKWLVNRL